MAALDSLLSFAVIIGFGIWAYSKIKRQTIRETFEEIRELFSGMKQNG